MKVVKMTVTVKKDDGRMIPNEASEVHLLSEWRVKTENAVMNWSMGSVFMVKLPPQLAVAC
jgi:hypothetical protein